MELLGKSIPLPLFPTAKQIAGVGMSECSRISDLLAQRFNYTNTFYHTEPKLDILNPEPRHEDAYDFVISSEVFEHIPPPVQPAFNNLARILRSDGFIIFSVPWLPVGATNEHFPELHDWQIAELKSGHVLVNRTADGSLQLFEDLIFHGGPGQTLEMRVFSRDDLLRNFEAAGFEAISLSEKEILDYGIVWESRGLAV
jgi:SAM-dependent methyltransferase